MSLPPLPEGATLDDELPPLPEGATLDAPDLPPLPAGATVDQPVTQAPAPEVGPGLMPQSSAPSIAGFTADDISRETRQAQRTSVLQIAWDASQKASPDDATATAAIAKKLGVSFDTVRANLPAFRAAAKAQDFEKWKNENPELADTIIAHPQLGTAIITSPDIDVFTKAWRAAKRWREDLVQESMSTPEEVAKERLLKKLAAKQMGFDVPEGDVIPMTPEERAAGKDIGGLTPEQVKAREAARAKEDIPKTEVQILTPEAAALRKVAEEDPSAVTRFGAKALGAMLRVEESYKALQKSHLTRRLAMADVGLSEEHPEDLLSEITDMDLKSRPLALGDEHGVWRDVAVAGQALASSAEIAKTSIAAGGLGYAAGAALGGGATLAITKNPAAAAEAAQGLGSLVGGKSASAAAFLAGAELEGSETYEKLRGSTTEDGTPISNEVAFITSYLLVGPAAGALESLSFGKMAAPFKRGLPEFITGLVKRDPAFRELLGRMFKQYAESVATETVTEFLQDGVHQVNEYVTKSAVEGRWQKKGYDLEQGLEAGYGGFAGAVVMGGAGGVHELATTKLSDARAEVDDRQVGPLLDAAKLDVIQADPDAWAETVRRESTKDGKAITAGHVDAVKTLRLLQEEGLTGPEAIAKVRELAGDAAAEDFQVAAITTTAIGAPVAKFEVPMSRMLSTWGASELGRALKDDTTLDANSFTPNQRKEQAQALDAEAKRIADEVVAKAEEASLLVDRQNEVVKQLTERGVQNGKSRADASEHARGAAKLITAFARNMGVDFAQAAKSVFPDTPFSFHEGDDHTVGTEPARAAQVDEKNPSASQVLTERFNAQVGDKAEERVTDFFLDPTTGVLNRRAFDRIDPAGRKIAVISIEGIKYANDNLGHDAGNAVYRSAAQALAPFFPEVAKYGGDFAVHVDSEEQLAEGLAKANQAGVLEGYRLTGGTGSMIDEAFQNAGRVKQDLETKGERAARGARPLGLQPLKEGEKPTALKGGLVQGTKINQALRDRLASEFEGKAAEQFREAYIEKESGLLTKDGWDRIPRKAHVGSLDLNGIKDYDVFLGKEATDAIIVRFSNALRELGGADFDAAHVSGDEYLVQSDDEAALKLWLEKAREAVNQAGIDLELSEEQAKFLGLASSDAEIRGLLYGYGVGKDIDHAEHALIADKERLAEAGKRGPGKALSRIADVGGSQAAEGSRLGSGEGQARDVGQRADLSEVGRQRLLGQRAEAARAPEGTRVDGNARAVGGDGEVPGWVTEGADQPVDERTDDEVIQQYAEQLIADREKAGSLRSEEAEALRNGFNLPQAVAEARFAVRDFTTKAKKAAEGETQQGTLNRAVEAKRRLDEKVKLATAFLDWVEGTGPRVELEPSKFDSDAVKKQKRDLETLFRDDFNVVDPAVGLTRLNEDNLSADEKALIASLKRDPTKKKNVALSRYAKIIKAERAATLKRNMGDSAFYNSRYNQEDPPGGAAAGGGEGPKKPPKGYTEIPAARRALETIKVFLNKSFDVSTVLHETAHGFLEHLADLAERADAPERTKDTYAAALKWLGVESRGQITRDHHEKWARTFEAYLMEGKSPSAALASAFQKFKLWLTGIYRSLQGIPKQDLNDEVRRVFDALLATEDELEAMKKKQGVENTAKPPGVSAAEWAAKLEEQRDEMEELSRKAQMLALKDRLRVTEKWWKQGMAKAEEEAGREYEELPARQAQLVLQGEHPVHSLNNEPIELDREAVEKAIGKKRRPGVRTAKNGVNPDTVAELAGFPTGEAMLKAVLELQPRDSWVRDTATQRMELAHPSVVTERTELRKHVQDALAGYSEKRLLAEQVIKGAEMETLRKAAALVVERQLLGKLNPHLALSRQRAASKAKAVASAKGEWAATHDAARAEALNAHMYSELLRAKEEREKLEERITRMGKGDFLAKLGKSAPPYRDAISYLLQAVGARDADPALTGDTLHAVIAQMNGDAAAIGDPAWLLPVQQTLGRTSDLTKMTVGEARDFAAALKHIEQAARDRTEVTDGEKRANKEDIINRFMVAIGAVVPRRKGIAEHHVRTVSEKVRVGLNAADGALLSPIDMVRDLTGDDQNNVLTQYIVNPVRRAAIREADLKASTLKPVMEALDALPRSDRKRWGNKVDGKAAFPTHVVNQGVTEPRYFHEKIAMALNAGSDSSMHVLTQGRNITEDQVRAFLADLTKEDIAFINTVHAAVGSLREEAFALEERITGVRPRAVEARPMVLPNGTLTGGYYPLKAIRDASTTGARMAGGDMAQLFDPSYTSPNTPHGWVNERTGATYPVSTDLAVGLNHVAAVVHDITHREVVKSVASLVLDKKVAGELQDHLGAPKAAEFLKWLKDLGGATLAENNMLDRVGSWVKSNMASSLLSGLGTAASNWANLPTAVASTKLKLKHLATAVSQLGGSTAFGFLEPTGKHALALEKSGILRSMEQDSVAGLGKQLRDPAAGDVKRALGWVNEAGMAVMKSVDRTVSTAVWLGAYEQALAEKMEDGAAVRFADDILLQVQPTSMKGEQAGILRNKTGLGAVLMFYGYLSVAYRAQHRIAAPLFTQDFQNSTPGQKSWKAAKVAAQMASFYIAYQVLGELLAGRGPEAGDDDEEKSTAGRWSNWFARKMVTAPLSTLPIAGSIFSAGVDSAFTGKPLMAQQRDPVSSALLQGVGTLLAASAAANDPTEAKKEKALKEVLRLVGNVTGLPTRFFDTTVRYMLETTFGDREVPNAGAAASGIVYGERDNQPDNIPKALGGN